jgi:hypothetical protein
VPTANEHFDIGNFIEGMEILKKTIVDNEKPMQERKASIKGCLLPLFRYPTLQMVFNI